MEVVGRASHPADVHGREWSHAVEDTGDVVGETHRTAGEDLEVGWSSAALRPSLFEWREVAPVGREPHREPSVGDLGAELRVLRPTGGEPDRDVGDRMHDRTQRFALADRARSPVRQRDLGAVVTDRCLSGEHLPDDGHVIAQPRRWMSPRLAVPAFNDLRTRHADPENTRPPPASASIVIACIASVAGGRAASCAIAVPSLIRSVNPARYASGDERVGCRTPLRSTPSDTRTTPRRGRCRPGPRDRRPDTDSVAGRASSAQRSERRRVMPLPESRVDGFPNDYTGVVSTSSLKWNNSAALVRNTRATVSSSRPFAKRVTTSRECG